jgi:hypothetical protein
LELRRLDLCIEDQWRFRTISRGTRIRVDSTINQLIATRFAKKQQREWTPRGAHPLLQLRVHVLPGAI